MATVKQLVTREEKDQVKDKMLALKGIIDELLSAIPCEGTNINNDTCGVTFTCWRCTKRKEIKRRVKDIMERE